MSNRTLTSFILAAAAVSSPIAFAAQSTSSPSNWAGQPAGAREGNLTRSQVVQETLLARRNGTLRSAGQNVEPAFAVPSGSTLSREDVMRETKSARSSGQLWPAGEAVLPVFAQVSGSSRTREQVKQETISARMNGTLVPAGEATEGQRQAQARRQAQTQIAAKN